MEVGIMILQHILSVDFSELCVDCALPPFFILLEFDNMIININKKEWGCFIEELEKIYIKDNVVGNNIKNIIQIIKRYILQNDVVFDKHFEQNGLINDEWVIRFVGMIEKINKDSVKQGVMVWPLIHVYEKYDLNVSGVRLKEIGIKK
jgi:hypothetical protein